MVNPPPNGIVISIGVLSGFGVGTPGTDAPNTSIAGRDAVVITERPGICGGEATTTAWIPSSNPINTPIVRACIVGSDVEAAERILQELLDSAT